MSNMFNNSCLTSLNVSSFDTSKVTDMSYMFYKLPLEELDISNFSTNSLSNVNYMIGNMSNLNKLYVNSSWNPNNITNNNGYSYNTNAEIIVK